MTTLARVCPALLALLFIGSCDFSHRTPDPLRETFDRAVDLFQRKKYQEARGLFEHSIAGFDRTGDQDKSTIARTYLAQILLDRREFRSALENLRRASAQVSKTGDALGNLRLTLLEGDVFFSAGDIWRAYEKFRSASSVADAFADRASSGESHLKIGRCLMFSGEEAEAVGEFQTALNLFQATGDARAVASAQLGLGMVYRRLHLGAEARDALSKGLAALGESDDVVLRSRLQTERGLVSLDQGNANAALQEFRQAANELRRQLPGSMLEPLELFWIGRVYERNARLDDARSFYREAITAAKTAGDRLAELSLTALLERMNTRALVPSERVPRGRELIGRLRAVAEQFRGCAYASGEAAVYGLMADVSHAMGDASSEREYLTRAVALDQSVYGGFVDPDFHWPYQESLGLIAGHGDWYLRLADVLVRLQRHAEALKVLDLARQKELEQASTGDGVALRHDKTRALASEVRLLVGRASLLERELSARLCVAGLLPDSRETAPLRSDLETMKRDIQAKTGSVISQIPNDGFVLPVQPVDPAVVQRFIPDGSLAVEFLVRADRLTIFALTRTRLAVRTVPVGGDSLVSMVRSYEQLMQDPRVYSADPSAASMAEITRFAGLSTRLYDLLLRPVENLFERSLILVPSGILDGFPFQTIERQDREGNVKYLIELTNVDYLPSLASLRYHVGTSSRVRTVTAFGNPTGKNWAVDYELRDLRSFFKDARVLVGLETSWDNLKSVSGDVLQIATEFSGQTAMLPMGELSLSNGLTTDRAVAVRFEMLSELPSIPVVLLSNQGNGSTRLGAAHAALLRANGTSDVFLNSWTADRKAAKFFSEYFYSYLAQGLAPGDAYRQALLNLMRVREVSQPRSWGQFFHFGLG